jgi:hypothetical protein
MLASIGTATSILVGVVAFWSVVLTGLLLHDQPARFLCGDPSCSAGDLARLFATSSFVTLWLAAPYVLAGWALWFVAPRLSRAIPFLLRPDGRGTRVTRWLVGTAVGLGHLWAAMATYAMLDLNPQGAYCAQVALEGGANFLGSGGPCHIDLVDLALLFARNMLLASIVLGALPLFAWLVMLLSLLLERAERYRRARRPID